MAEGRKDGEGRKGGRGRKGRKGIAGLNAILYTGLKFSLRLFEIFYAIHYQLFMGKKPYFWCHNLSNNGYDDIESK